MCHGYFCKKNKVDRFNTTGIKMIDLIWSEWGDSNARSLEPKSSAIPPSLHPERYHLRYTRIFDFFPVWVRYGSGPFDPYCDPYYFNLIFNFFKR